jgi:Seed dormancy control
LKKNKKLVNFSKAYQDEKVGIRNFGFLKYYHPTFLNLPNYHAINPGWPLKFSYLGAAMFDIEYARWLDENQHHMNELRGSLAAHLSDGELRIIVEGCLTHYDDLFQLKAVAAKADVFHLITGLWATPAERCFLWMGGFRPSEVIKVYIIRTRKHPLILKVLLTIYICIVLHPFYLAITIKKKKL